VFENHEIFTLPRNNEKPSVFENHQIFTLPRNHEKPSKCLKIMKAMRFSHCPEIMKTVKKFENHEIFTLPRNNEKPSKSIKKSSDFHIAQKS
jgi:hypothetical protein